MAIQAVLPRRNTFSRRAAGTVPYEQVIAANIDTVFIVSGLDDNHSLRRVERCVAQGWDSGAVPVVPQQVRRVRRPWRRPAPGGAASTSMP